MIDLKFIRENIKLVEENIRSRGVKLDLKQLVALDEERKELLMETEGLRNERNKMSKTKPTEVEIAEMRKLGDKRKELEEQKISLEEKLDALLCQIPNLNHETTPRGKDESENKVVARVGEKPKFSFPPKQHFEIPAVAKMIDSESGAKVSGSRFYYLKGTLVKLERAIMEYGLQKAAAHRFELILPPLLVREKAMFGTGFFPAEKNEIYQVNPSEDNLFLIGTAEVPLIAMAADKIFEEKELPKKYCAITPCFRREAGSYGKDQSGILRVHQFYKVEMVVFSRPEESWKIHEEILAIEKELLKCLGLPFQVVNICSGDMGFPAAKKYDCEAWMPGQEKYREMTSASNTTDFQARRLNIKYRKILPQGRQENIFVHTLNGTMVTDRTMLAVLENFQTKKGTVKIPKALKKLCGFAEIK